LRNWSAEASEFILFPYDTKLAPLNEPLPKPLARHLGPHKEALENCVISGSIKKKETHLKWFEFRRLARAKFEVELNILNPHIATHCHFQVCDHGIVFKEKAIAIALRSEFSADQLHLCCAWLNSSLLLEILKRECFNKGAGEDEHRDRFEFAGEKLRSLNVPDWLDESLHQKSNSLRDRLAALSRACWKRGQELPSLALRKLFEQSGEAYAAWNAALPGHVPPHAKLPAPFSTTAELRAACQQAIKLRENLRVEMIALQEEMDWLVYSAYGLLPENSPAVAAVCDRRTNGAGTASLQENERPFRLWAKADGDFTKAIALIPSGWPAARKKLWEARLAAIRDNEHIRRIEQPVYKRRWDEQWKVSNSWLAGPVAYAQELVDAFRWWLVEKAEWHLEHKAKGGPLSLDAWSIALASDARVQAAWPVIADAMTEIETWKLQIKRGANGSEKIVNRKSAIVNSSAALIKFFRDAVNEETVPDGIPAGVSWEELEKKMTVPKQAKNVRGKLNVPRERFRQRETGYVWAGKN
jgi:hypothetical protein